MALFEFFEPMWSLFCLLDIGLEICQFCLLFLYRALIVTESRTKIQCLTEKIMRNLMVLITSLSMLFLSFYVSGKYQEHLDEKLRHGDAKMASTRSRESIDILPFLWVFWAGSRSETMWAEDVPSNICMCPHEIKAMAMGYQTRYFNNLP